MAHRIESRLAKLETIIRAPSIQELSADERAVLCIALVQSWLPALRERAKQAAESGRARCVTDRPEWKALYDGILLANDRVAELESQGRLGAVVERLKALGRWPNEEAA